MSEPSDERVEAKLLSADELQGWRDMHTWGSDTYQMDGSQIAGRRLLQHIDALTAERDAANTRAERLDDIIEFIRTYDPNVVDSAEAYYPENHDEASRNKG